MTVQHTHNGASAEARTAARPTAFPSANHVALHQISSRPGPHWLEVLLPDDEAAMFEALARTPDGARLIALIDFLRTDPADVTDEMLAPHFVSAPRVRQLIGNMNRRSGGLKTITGYARPNERASVLYGKSSDGMDIWVAIVVDPLSERRVGGLAGGYAPADIILREAVEADAAGLAKLECETPLVLGEDKVFYDKSRDYFAGERLMGGRLTLAERAGEIVALAAGVSRDIRVNGVLYRSAYAHRARVHPNDQQGGVGSYLGLINMTYHALTNQFPHAFVAEDNARVINNSIKNGAPLWAELCERLTFDTGALAGPAAGRAADQSDCARLVELLNDMHEREELFVPYTSATFAERLSRDPKIYAFRDFLVSERAAIGLWNACWGVRREGAHGTTNDVRSLVLDYGCEAGAEEELLALLGALAARLAREGATEFTLFTSPGSRGFDALTAAAKRRERYVVNCIQPPGPDVARHGIYVDQMYF